jgi:hypothetical protein
MPVISKRKDPLQDLIETLADKQAEIQDIVIRIEHIATNLPEEIEDKVLESLRVRVLEALRDHAHDPSLDLVQLYPNQTNFDRVVSFLRSCDKPQTVEQIMNATKIAKGSLSLVLYGKRKDVFEKEKAGEGKKLAWKLKSTVKTDGATM